MAGVVGSDGEDDRLRLVAVELAVVDSPEQMFGAVSAEAKLQGVVWRAGEVLFPGRLAGALPVVRDRVANEDNGRAAGLDGLLLLREALRPP